MYKILSFVLIITFGQSQGFITDGLFQSLKPLGGVVDSIGQLLDAPVNGLLSGLKLSDVLDRLLTVVDPVEEALLCQVIPNVLVPVVDCTDPFQNVSLLAGQMPNCFADCVCIHGFNSGHCAPSAIAKGGKACICSMDIPNNDQAALYQFRTDACAKNQVVQAAFNTLCGLNTFNKVFHGACNADCRCGHEMKQGICTQNGDVNTNNKGLCQCVN